MKYQSTLSELAQKLDELIDTKDKAELIKHAYNIERELSVSSVLDDQTQATLLYYLCNIYSSLIYIEGDLWGNDNIAKAIICYRKMERIKANIGEIKRKAAVNVANIMSSTGRAYEAISIWKNHLNILDEARIVATLRMSQVILGLSYFYEDKDDTFFFQLFTYKSLKPLYDNLSKITYPELHSSFNPEHPDNLVGFYEFAHENFEEEIGIDDPLYEVKFKKNENLYRQWCSNNTLFLSPLNSISNSKNINVDTLSFPSYTVSVREGPYLAASFSALCNEYTFNRHMLYEGVFSIYPRFVNKGKVLVDTLDSVCYDAGTEKIKSSIKGCFSILDKISIMLHQYFELKGKIKDVKFNRCWFDKSGLKNKENTFLCALYWLSKDFSPHENDGARLSYWLEDRAHNVRELRNDLEHGWVRVYMYEDMMNAPWEGTHDYARKISQEALKEKALYIFQQTRNALLYLQMAVYQNENRKPKQENRLSMATPFVKL